MSVFTLQSIIYLSLNYVEWLEQRRGCRKQQGATENGGVHYQSVAPATIATYLNGLVAIVKYQLQDDIQLRDSLLDQLRNLRSQAESYSMTQKKFEKVHPEWCSWKDLQIAREKCRSLYHQADYSGHIQRAESERTRHAYLLHLREVCLLCLFSICPPPRCLIIRLLEWDKTLVRDSKQVWMMDLTDLSHEAGRHKTHKRKGTMQLPLPQLIYPYLNELYGAMVSMCPTTTMALQPCFPVFPAGLLSTRERKSTSRRSLALSLDLSPLFFMDSTGFNHFVKQTFQKYTESHKAPNPSLLRSDFTTWLYSLRYDTEDTLLQQLKASSAKWKAHSERMTATVYNKELVYQKKEFSVLLRFCELYSNQFSQGSEQKHDDDELPTKLRKKRKSASTKK